MKIAFVADPHFDFLPNHREVVQRMNGAIVTWGADAVCVGGDICHCCEWGKVGGSVRSLLTANGRTYFVLGNHDLWSLGLHRKMQPDEAMSEHLSKYFCHGNSLEKVWGKDVHTVYDNGSAVFVGTMGFPDFMHPLFKKSKSYYDFNGCTNDINYMKLSLGWLRYTLPLQDGFYQRLEKAVATKAKDVVVVTHYNILDEQRIPSGEDIAAYFFNYSIGQKILQVAKEHPDKRFWCLSGHSHEFCDGTLKMAAENVYAFGLKTTYREKHIFFLDTDAEMNQDREAKPV